MEKHTISWDIIGIFSGLLLIFPFFCAVFLSAAEAFFNSTGGLSGHKRSLLEGGVRSPSMVRWPGTLAKGRSSELPWAFWDVLPTVQDRDGRPVFAGILGATLGEFWIERYIKNGSKRQRDMISLAGFND